MEEIKIKNLSEYIESIKKIYSDKNFVKNYKGLFYRGISKSSYKLLPLIYRDKKLKEREVLLNYRDNLPRIEKQHLDLIKNRLEILANMQHYGLPTRLLDWTMNPLIALYFAVKDKFNDLCPEQSVVWVFNPWTYEKELRPCNASTNWFEMSKLARALLSDRGFEDIKDILRSLFFGDSSLVEDDVKYPFPLIAKFQNQRMIHQAGVFTIQGMCKCAMEDMEKTKEYLKKITIPYNERESILEELNLLDINEYTVFPDFEGMRNQINDKGSLYNVK